MRVFMTGASGFIGKAVAAALTARGDEVVALSRSPRMQLANQTWIVGDPMQPGAWQKVLRDCDAVVHLAGENIGGKRWSEAFKKALYDSRIDGTRNVVGALPGTNVKTFVCANGIDWYPPDESDRPYAEDHEPPASGFMADICRDWQREALVAESHGARTVVLRTGMILGAHGGILEPMIKAFKLMVGGPLGSGRQWFSWMHLDDCVGSVLHALDRDAVRGPLNQVAPGAVRQKDFAKALGRALKRPAVLPTPRFALKLALGELGELATHGRRVVPAKLEQTGYQFRYPRLDEALASLT